MSDIHEHPVSPRFKMFDNGSLEMAIGDLKRSPGELSPRDFGHLMQAQSQFTTYIELSSLRWFSLQLN